MRSFLRPGLQILFFMVAAASLLLAGYLLQPLTATVSAKWIGLLAALYLGLAGLAWVQGRFWIAPLWKLAGKRLRIIWIVSAVLLGIMCFLLLTPAGLAVLEKFPIFAPVEQVEVRVALEGDQAITIQRIKINNRQVPSASISLFGEWQSDGLELSTTDSTASLVITDRVPHSLEIAFLRSPDAGQAIVSWAGQQQRIDLRSSIGQGAVYSFIFDRSLLPPATVWIRLLTLPAWFEIALAACGVLYALRLMDEKRRA